MLRARKGSNGGHLVVRKQRSRNEGVVFGMFGVVVAWMETAEPASQEWDRGPEQQ